MNVDNIATTTDDIITLSLTRTQPIEEPTTLTFTLDSDTLEIQECIDEFGVAVEYTKQEKETIQEWARQGYEETGR